MKTGAEAIEPYKGIISDILTNLGGQEIADQAVRYFEKNASKARRLSQDRQNSELALKKQRTDSYQTDQYNAENLKVNINPTNSTQLQESYSNVVPTKDNQQQHQINNNQAPSQQQVQQAMQINQDIQNGYNQLQQGLMQQFQNQNSGAQNQNLQVAVVNQVQGEPKKSPNTQLTAQKGKSVQDRERIFKQFCTQIAKLVDKGNHSTVWSFVAKMLPENFADLVLHFMQNDPRIPLAPVPNQQQQQQQPQQLPQQQQQARPQLPAISQPQPIIQAGQLASLQPTLTQNQPAPPPPPSVDPFKNNLVDQRNIIQTQLVNNQPTVTQPVLNISQPVQPQQQLVVQPPQQYQVQGQQQQQQQGTTNQKREIRPGITLIPPGQQQQGQDGTLQQDKAMQDSFLLPDIFKPDSGASEDERDVRMKDDSGYNDNNRPDNNQQHQSLGINSSKITIEKPQTQFQNIQQFPRDLDLDREIREYNLQLGIANTQNQIQDSMGVQALKNVIYCDVKLPIGIKEKLIAKLVGRFTSLGDQFTQKEALDLVVDYLRNAYDQKNGHEIVLQIMYNMLTYLIDDPMYQEALKLLSQKKDQQSNGTLSNGAMKLQSQAEANIEGTLYEQFVIRIVDILRQAYGMRSNQIIKLLTEAPQVPLKALMQYFIDLQQRNLNEQFQQTILVARDLVLNRETVQDTMIQYIFKASLGFSDATTFSRIDIFASGKIKKNIK